MSELLSQDEKAKIRAEEILRHEIRTSLEPRRSKWWAFLNSAFGLWLLGTASVGILTWTYGEIRDRQQERSEARALKRRLRTEIDARVDAAGYVFRSTEFHDPRPEVDDYGEAANILNGQAGHSTYPDFAGRKLSSLIIQLRDGGSCGNADLQATVAKAEALEAEFSKWRRRTVVRTPEDALDFVAARKALDRKFARALTEVEQELKRSCN